MIDFKNLKKLTIGGVELKQLFINGIQVWKAISYTNQIPISTDKSGNIYNGKGFKENTAILTGNEQSVNGKDSTGWIPCKVGDIIRLKNVDFDNDNNCRLVFYKSDKTYINQVTGNATYILNTSFKGIKDSSGNYTQLTITSRSETTNCAYIRMTANDINANSIITINQEITD